MILYRIIRPVAWVFFMIAFWPRVEGREHLPKTGGFVVCMNHVSGFDPPLVSVIISRPVVHLTKIELYRIPILGPVLRGLGTIPIHRGETDPAAMKAAVRALRAGFPMSVFPEGTRHLEARGQARRGAAFLAAHAGVPIVPGAIRGRYRLWHRIDVRFGPPITVSAQTGPGGQRQRLEAAAQEVMAVIHRLRDGADAGGARAVAAVDGAAGPAGTPPR